MENELFAAVITGKGTGAISTIQLLGKGIETVIRKIFKSAGSKLLQIETGQILFGTIQDNEKIIDQVIIGCEGPSLIAIHCHGNPLIVEKIIKLLKKNNVQILTYEQFYTKILSCQKQLNAIAIEAKFVQSKAKTIEGTKIVLNQVDSGLGKIIQNWLDKIEEMPINEIHEQIEEIFRSSTIAKLIIFGCKVILIGPPNTGKSTLLNCLAGKEKSIVTDISGTTRDWVTAQCKIESLCLELIDTAGLDENLSTNIDSLSQKKTLELIELADIVLLVLDNSKDSEFDNKILETISGKKIITILNKSDLPEKFDTSKLPDFLQNIVRISAQKQTGIENLIEAIRKKCGVANYNLQSPVCFTDRQENLLKRIKQTESKDQIITFISELLEI